MRILWIHRGDFNWWSIKCLKRVLAEIQGVIHEYADCVGKQIKAWVTTLDKIGGDYHIEARTMGNQLKVQDDQKAKYSKDAETLIDV